MATSASSSKVIGIPILLVYGIVSQRLFLERTAKELQ